MHFLVTWRFRNPERRNEAVIVELISAFSGQSFSKAMEDTFVVSVASQEDYKSIIGKLTQVAKDYTKEIHFMATPPISFGKYNGWLPKSVWEKVNAITSESEDV
jgi:hypothetical protein